MLELRVKELSREDSNILEKAGFSYDDVYQFETYEELYEACQVIGRYKAFEIVQLYGTDEAQDIANEWGIAEPIRNIEELATAIVTTIVDNEVICVETCINCKEICEIEETCLYCDGHICVNCLEEFGSVCEYCMEWYQ